MSMRKLLAMITVTVVVLLAIGLPTYAESDEREEILVWMWPALSSDHYMALYDWITEWFEEENPGYTLNFQLSGHQSGEPVITAAAAGIPPDVTLIVVTSLRSLYERGVLLPLNEFIERSPNLSLDDFLPMTTAFSQKEGVVFGLPWSLEARAVLYNREFLDEAGLDSRREALRTWDDILTYGRQLVRRDPQGGISRSGFVIGSNWIDFTSYLYANGGNFYNESYTAAAFNDTRGVEMLELIHRFNNEYDVATPGVNWREVRDLSGAMAIGDTSAVGGFQRRYEDFADWLDMAPIPRGPQADGPSTVLWSNSFVIPNGAPDPEKSWKFFEFWFRSDVQEQVFIHFDRTSVRTARRDFYQTSTFHEALREFPYLAVLPEIFSSGKPFPFVRGAEIERAIAPILAQVRAGKLAPASALTDAERIVNSILSQ